MTKYIVLLSILIFQQSILLSFEECDTVRACLGNALTLTVPTGRGVHYVDVMKTESHKLMNDAFTFELWMKPQRQAGFTQFIAGLWGPSFDKNDAWVLYFSDKDSLVFEINHPDVNLKRTDNTIVSYYAIQLYDKWNHVAAVFDGSTQSASLFINGVLVASSRNSLYPAYRLRSIANPELSIQIGSTNALSDSHQNRAFLGQMDEIRIWAKSLTQIEIYCQKDLSLTGNEDRLILYYRCNEVPSNFTLCDASGNSNFGKARSGASCQKSDRIFRSNLIASPLSISDTIVCDTRKTYTFTVRDTSVCTNRIWMRIIDNNYKEIPIFTITPRSTYLQPNQPITFTVTIDANFTGQVNGILQIIPYNNCRTIINIPLKITRIGELSYSKISLDMDTLIAHCIEKPYIDSIISLCNVTNKSSLPKVIRIDKLLTKFPEVFQIISKPLPIILQPGECTDITVRFLSQGKTNTYFDTLTIISNDKCSGTGKIPLIGRVQEAIAITYPDGKTKLDSIDFGTICVNFASQVINYNWRNLLNVDITVDSIIFPQNFTGRTFRYPITLKTNTGYLPNYLRFVPKIAGIIKDSIIFVVKAGACTIYRPVYVKGKGFLADVRFLQNSLNFGNVVVGQEQTQNFTVQNFCDDTLSLSFYLRKGEVFFLTGAKAIILAPGQIRNIPLTFRPINGIDYFDEICLYERRCFSSLCIPINGKGIIEKFDFIPKILEINNVVGCSYDEKDIVIKNISGKTQTLTNFIINDPSNRFTLVEPDQFPKTLYLQNNESIKFKFRYTPADSYTDRADWAFLNFRDEQNVQWAAKLYGSSFSPKIFITDPVDFGTIEVGNRKRQTIIIENISPVPVKIDSINLPLGFELIYPSTSNFNKLLKPRDTLRLIVDFVPQIENDYSQFLLVHSSEPCIVDFSTLLIGKSIIVPLEVPISVLSFGFILPCDCSTRQIPLLNQSFVNKMVIDSLWIDGEGVVNPYPEFFSWRSFFSPNSTLPFEIPAWSRDTLEVIYCPRSISNRQFLDHSAKLNINASGIGWERSFYTYLAGKQTLMLEAIPTELNFSPTRVDTLSVPLFTKITIPETAVNPDRLPVKIDSITFQPNERVFYVYDSLGNNFPLICDVDNELNLVVYFKPRAVRNYSAKMVIHTNSPCEGIDTTILVTGSSFAPAYGLSFNFDNFRVSQDTFRLINCDTLLVPVYTSREIPADIIDIQFRFGYDTTKLALVGADSPYLKDTCSNFQPAISFKNSLYGGSDVILKNLCNVDSTKPFIIAKFISKITGPDTTSIIVDSIKFDTEGVLLYHLIADPDDAIVIILKPSFTVINSLDFDSVRVLDCVQRQLIIQNNGDVPIAIWDIINLPKDFRIVSSSPPLNQLINTGEIIEITIEYCPRRKRNIDTNIIAVSQNPCQLTKDVIIKAIAYVPELPFGIDFSQTFTINDTIYASIGDIIDLPIYFEKDFSDIRNGIEYWLLDISFNLDVFYNPRSLKFMQIDPAIKSNLRYDYVHGHVNLMFKNVDSLKAGKIANLKFLVVVPDSIVSSININAHSFETDSIMFLELIPIPEETIFVSIGKCQITNLRFTTNSNYLKQNSPNPWSEYTSIEFSIMEKSAVKLAIYNGLGQLVDVILDGSLIFSPGVYKLTLNSSNLPSGIYIYTINAGVYSETKQMLLLK